MFNNLKRKIMFCLDKVIFGFIPRIHLKHHALCCHYRACPDNLDPRDGLFVTPEDDSFEKPTQIFSKNGKNHV